MRKIRRWLCCQGLPSRIAMQTRQTPYQINCSRLHRGRSPLPMLCRRLPLPNRISTARSVSIATMSTTTPSRKSMPSALTFDRHAKCSVRPSKISSTIFLTHDVISSIDNQGARQYPEITPWRRPTTDLHARRDTSIP